MSMTRKDFETVAWIVSCARKAVMRTGDGHVLAQFDAMFIPNVVDEMKTKNPRFDEAKFLAACGVTA